MKFRNVDVDPSRPLDEWPAEAIEILVDRGVRSDWKRLVATIRANPWGPAARTADTVARWGEHDGVDVLILDAVADARRAWDEHARRRYAERIRSWRRQAGLTQRQLAELVGTSASRLSAYENARVAPTTDVLGRIEQVVATLTFPPPIEAREVGAAAATRRR
jgi:DNA-binding XRE family transcriptional regulator